MDRKRETPPRKRPNDFERVSQDAQLISLELLGNPKHHVYLDSPINEILFIQTNDAYRNRLRQLILEGVNNARKV